MSAGSRDGLRRLRRPLRIALFLACMLMPLEQVHALSVVDQENLDDDVWGAGSVVPLAQTFTVGIDGVLDAVEARLWFPVGEPEVITVQIRTTEGGIPSSTVLGTSSALVPVGFENVLTLTHFDFSADAIEVRPGDALALVALPPGRQINWNSSRPENSVYTGGTGWFENSPGNWLVEDFDFHFRTFVPEPRSTVLQVSALTVVFLLARRARRFTREI